MSFDQRKQNVFAIAHDVFRLSLISGRPNKILDRLDLLDEEEHPWSEENFVN